jgi:hypothetical protein
MIMYVLNRLAEPERNKVKPDPRNYSAVFIVPGAQDEKTHETEVEMHIQSRIDDELREEKLLGRIFEAFPLPVTRCTYEQKNVEADFLAPSPGNLDIPLFYDMVLTDPLISQIMLIQESSRTFRERGRLCLFPLQHSSAAQAVSHLPDQLWGGRSQGSESGPRGVQDAR